MALISGFVALIAGFFESQVLVCWRESQVLVALIADLGGIYSQFWVASIADFGGIYSRFGWHL